MKGTLGVEMFGRPDAPVPPAQATRPTPVSQEADVPDMYTSSTDEALLQSLVETSRSFAQRYPRGLRSHQNLSTSTLLTSAAPSTVTRSPIFQPTTSHASAEVPSRGKNPVRLASPSSRPSSPTGGATAMARRKPVPSLVPLSVRVTATEGEDEDEGEDERDANGNFSSSALPFPLPPTPTPAAPNSTYLSPAHAEGPTADDRRSRASSGDTFAVVEEQRRKRAVLHGRGFQYDDDADAPAPADDAHARPELGLEPEEDEDEGAEAAGARSRGGEGGGVIPIPFPDKLDSPYYPPSVTQRQLLQATGASARRRREHLRDSTYTEGTTKSHGKAFKGWMGKLRRFKLFGVKFWWIVRP